MGICGAMYATSGSANQSYHLEHEHSEIWKQSEQQRVGVSNVDSGDIEWFCKYFRPFIMLEDTGIAELIQYGHGMKLGVEMRYKSLGFVQKYVK